jgi:hypothetical protein
MPHIERPHGDANTVGPEKAKALNTSTISSSAAEAAQPNGAHDAIPSITLSAVIETFKRWLYLPDILPLFAVLGTVAANMLEGDPVWLLLIGPPGGGKTELLQPLTALNTVHFTSTLTEASLLSATPTREKTKDATGGLLRKIGDWGVLLCKDFTSVLSMNRDSRASVLAALREIYDGCWTRHVGTDGGRTLHWSGKLGLIGACTSIIDSHHAVIAAMGERFIMFRLPAIDEEELTRRALDHQGAEIKMRAELASVTKALFAALPEKSSRPLTDQETQRLIALATLVVKCRSAVERNGYSREVELIPEAEAPSRLALALSHLFAGLTLIGASRADSWRVINRVALDSMPALRKQVIGILAGTSGPVDTITVAEAIRYPTQTTRRTLEDLTAHGVLSRISQGQGKADLWRLSDWTQRKCIAAGITFPEMSDEEN